MNKKLPFTFLLFVITNLSFGQNSWQAVYSLDGFDRGYSMVLTTDGGFAVTGASLPLGEGENFIYLLKVNSNGDIEWSDAFGEDVGEIGQCIRQCSDGSFIVVANVEDLTNGDVYINLIRLTANGNLLWERRSGAAISSFSHHGGGRGFSVQQTSDGGFMVTGASVHDLPAGNDIFLLRTDGNGDTLWTRSFDAGNWDESGYSVKQTSDSGFIVAGLVYNSGVSGYNLFLIKTNPNGDTLWTKSFGNGSIEGYNSSCSVEQTTDKGYIVTGGILDTINNPNYNVLLFRTDSSGNVLWTRSYGGNKSEHGNDVHQTFDGGFIIAGYSNVSGQDTADVYLIKTDANGDTLWTKTYGGLKEDEAYSISQTNDSGYLVAGYTMSFGFQYGVYIIKTDANGNSECNERTTSTNVLIPPIGISNHSFVISSGGIDSLAYGGIYERGGTRNNLCMTVNIHPEANNQYSSIQFYPNPFSNTLVLTGTCENGEVILFDLTGKEILRQKLLAKETKLNLENISSGFYLLHYSDKLRSENFKVVKQ